MCAVNSPYTMTSNLFYHAAGILFRINLIINWLVNNINFFCVCRNSISDIQIKFFVLFYQHNFFDLILPCIWISKNICKMFLNRGRNVTWKNPKFLVLIYNITEGKVTLGFLTKLNPKTSTYKLASFSQN